jgi:hypothetical protein
VEPNSEEHFHKLLASPGVAGLVKEWYIFLDEHCVAARHPLIDVHHFELECTLDLLTPIDDHQGLGTHRWYVINLVKDFGKSDRFGNIEWLNLKFTVAEL